MFGTPLIARLSSQSVGERQTYNHTKTRQIQLRSRVCVFNGMAVKCEKLQSDFVSSQAAESVSLKTQIQRKPGSFRSRTTCFLDFKVTVGSKIIYSELHIIRTIKLHTPIRNPITCAWLKPLFQQASAHNLKISEEEESTTFIVILSQHLIIPTVKALGLILK